MKYKACPSCGCTNLGDRWSITGRKLQQYCHNSEGYCNWEGEPRLPEQRKLTNTKTVWIGDRHGWDFIIYDKYGYEITLSMSYDSRQQAIKELKRRLAKGKENKVYGPYTGVLFKTPPFVKLHGEMFE